MVSDYWSSSRIEYQAYRVSKTEYLCIYKEGYAKRIYFGLHPSDGYVGYTFSIKHSLITTYRIGVACYPIEFKPSVKELE